MRRTALGVEGRAFLVCPVLLTPSSPQEAGKLCSGGPGSRRVHCGQITGWVSQDRCLQCGHSGDVCEMQSGAGAGLRVDSGAIWPAPCCAVGLRGGWLSLVSGEGRRQDEGLEPGEMRRRPILSHMSALAPSHPVGTLLLSLSWGSPGDSGGQDTLLPGSLILVCSHSHVGRSLSSPSSGSWGPC